MANSEEKIQTFLQAIDRHAQEQREQIHREVEAFKSQRLHTVEQEVLREAYGLVRKERAELRDELSREMSGRYVKAKAELLTRRQEILSEVFAAAREKLLAFAQSDDYPAYLNRVLDELLTVLPADGSVFFLRPQDEPLLPALRERCPQSRFETDAAITLGGIRGENEQRGLVADDTLDEKLNSQHAWFVENSGLVLS